jgi:hypothetical protein
VDSLFALSVRFCFALWVKDNNLSNATSGWSSVSEKDSKIIAVDVLRVVRLLEELMGETLGWIREKG